MSTEIGLKQISSDAFVRRPTSAVRPPFPRASGLAAGVLAMLLGNAASAAGTIGADDVLHAREAVSAQQAQQAEHAQQSDGEHRSAGQLARTIDFIGLAPDMTIVAVGSGESDITRALAASLAQSGALFVADVSGSNTGGATRASDEFSARALRLSQTMASERSVFGRVVLVPFAPPVFADIRPPGGADLAVVHAPITQWRSGGTAAAAFVALRAALKPGAALVVVSPAEGIDPNWVVREAEAAGLRRTPVSNQPAEGRIGLRFVRPAGSVGTAGT